MLFDSHAHLDQAEFDHDLADVIARAREAGVTRIVSIGTTAASSRKCCQIAATYEGLYAAVGIQPNSVQEVGDHDWPHILELVGAPGVVAIGETGLDRYWDMTPFPQQQAAFAKHLQLAQQTDLPVVIHMRDCGPEVLAMLREAADRGPLRGVMHSFTGTPQLASDCVAVGMHISFAGMVTFKKSTALRECAAAIPADRLLVETDSPYLSPHPVRKVRRNEPAQLVHTVSCLAEVRGVTSEALAEQTTRNAQALFRVE